MKSFISAQPDLATVAPKLQEAGDNIAPVLQAELDGIAKKHGFASFSELDDVAANISIVMAGLDSKSGDFTEPVEALKKDHAGGRGFESRRFRTFNLLVDKQKITCDLHLWYFRFTRLMTY